MNENQPIYYPLFGKLEGACAFIMVARSGQANEETTKEWKTLMKVNGIELEEDELLLAKDYDKFIQVMKQNGWKEEFIAFGP
jgi:hypothetical protein